MPIHFGSRFNVSVKMKSPVAYVNCSCAIPKSHDLAYHSRSSHKPLQKLNGGSTKRKHTSQSILQSMT